MHMEMESDSQSSGHKVPGLTGNADSMVPLPESPVNTRHANEPGMEGTSSLVKQDPPDMVLMCQGLPTTSMNTFSS